MAPRELPNGQIVPAAQPVDAFIRPAQLQARAGLPQIQLPGAPQLRTIQQGSGGSVQGFNQWAQLADALAPFSDAVMKTAMRGVDLYASSEYEKGQNEAIRAQVLANQQRERAGGEYAAETRRMEGVDPVGARMMDKVNPFREAGRVNQLSRLAGAEAKSYIVNAYRSSPDAATWDPRDPRLTELRAGATQQLLKRFGLNESTAGFQDYVVPEIGQAWDRVTNEQWEDRQNFLKDTVAPMTATEVLATYANLQTAGTVEWDERDWAGRVTRRTAVKGTPEFREGIRARVNQVLDRIGQTMGIRGETTEQTRKTLLQLLETAKRGDGATQELIDILGDVEVGPPDKDGYRATAKLLFAPMFLDAADERERLGFERQARQEKTALEAFNNDLFDVMGQLPEGDPQRKAAIEQLIAKGRKMGLPMKSMLEAVDEAGGTVANIAMRETDTTSIDDFFVALEEMDPAAWNTPGLLKQLKQQMAGLPQEEQKANLKRFASLASSKGKEGQNQKGSVINPVIDRAVRAALSQQYPSSVSQAAMRGVKDLQGFMAMGDVNMRTSAQRLSDGLRKHIQTRLAEAARAKGSRLSAPEETAVATAASSEYLNTKDKNLREYLYPGGLNGGPGVEGGRVAQPTQNTRGENVPTLPPGRKPNPVPVVTSSNLDNVDPKVLQSGAVVLRKPDTLQEVERVLMGQPPSAAVQRAARAAGMPVGQWLLKQADGYPGSLTPGARQELLRRTNQGQAAGQKVSSAGRSSSPFAAAGMWLADILMGTRPAMASQGGGGSQFPFTRRPEAGGDFPSGGRYTPIKGVIITSAVDPESPGFDMAIEGGRRGAQFRWPMAFRVVDMEINRRENNMERTGNRSDRFYGTNVTLRFRSPVDGKEYDVISSHHDSLNPALRRGGSYPAGTFLGTQGRTGSTTGTHTSLDVYVAGTRRAAPMAVRSHLRDGFAKGSTFGGGGGRPMPAQGTLSGRATYYTGSGGSDGVLGGKTANGETFTGRQMTAAVQWSLKPKLMNKWLIVEDTKTGRRIRVWANDTGQMGGTNKRPADRLIDLSPVAFEKLFGSTRQGVGNIRVTVDPNQRGRP